MALAAAFAALQLTPILGALDGAQRGSRALVGAQDALRAADAATARKHLDVAAEAFAGAKRRLSTPWLAPSRFAPVLGTNLAAAEGLVMAGQALAEIGPEAVAALAAGPAGGWRLHDGALDLEAVGRVAVILERVGPRLAGARERIEATPASWLHPRLADARRTALAEVTAAQKQAGAAAGAARLLPPMLGASGPRRYLVAIANPAEQRGTGGFIGYMALLEANGGRLRVQETGRPTALLPPPSRKPDLRLPDWFREAYARWGSLSLWQNVNVSADFPAVADLVAQTVDQAGSIGAIDGMIQIDPTSLAALLALTGPVGVPSWPEPLRAGNVERVASHEIYLRFGDDSTERYEFLGRLAQAVTRRLTSGEVAFGTQALGRLGDAVAGGHVKVWSPHPGEQAELAALGLAGEVERAREATDVLGFVTENWSGSKIDWFLRREVGYEVRLEPDGSTRGLLRARLRNQAPADGLPAQVIGPYNDNVERGWNRQLMLLLRHPADRLERFRVDGKPAPTGRDLERFLRSHTSFLLVAPGGQVDVRAEFALPEAMTGEGRHRTYRLHVLRQPVAHADRYDVRVVAPRGWNVRGPTSFSGPLTRDLVLEVRLEQTRRAWAIQNFVLDPLRAGLRLIRSAF